ncbi:Bicyclomycin resistance protein [Vibrio mediterranei]|uniref:Bcr/CflA family multidrug efflux MFS transporter n=1 Tax=Vibrio mediterranei TaxID=689 RepID=UPI0007858562|nr:Bcr/CflA family multidrug efflux MFS transporter [Vibrio mediterranei]SBO12512.1 Bicyclomycin resistance protein [Vibrio mediterranei]
MTENVLSEVPAQPKLGFIMFAVLGLLGALTPMAINMYLSAMPDIASDLGSTASDVQLTLTVYLAGFAIGQMLYGPLADSFGRRPVLLTGVLFFAIAAALSAVATEIESLMYIRFIQGVAGAAAQVIILAIIRDMFEREDFARVMSFVTLVITVAPLTSPSIGGYLAIWFGWRSIFWTLAILATVGIVLTLWRIPETLSTDNRQPLHVGRTVRNYIDLFKNPSAMGLIWSGAFSFAGMFAFLTAGAFVYIDIFGVKPEQFGYLVGLNIIAMFIITTINGRLVKKLGTHTMLKLGLWTQLTAGIGLVLVWALNLGLWSTVIFVALFIGTLSAINSNTMAILLSGYPSMAGTATSLAGTMRFGTGALVGAVVALLPNNEIWPMIFSMAACGTLSIGFYWVLGRKA